MFEILLMNRERFLLNGILSHTIHVGSNQIIYGWITINDCTKITGNRKTVPYPVVFTHIIFIKVIIIDKLKEFIILRT